MPRILAALTLFALTACSPEAGAQVSVALVTDAVSLPVRLVSPPDDPRLFVVEQDGLIKVFDHDGALRDVFLDLTALTNAGGERGLLGLAFAPDYAASGRFYVNYTDSAGDTRIARYAVSADPDRADPQSAEILLTIDQPYGNHNGGHLEFGPDGMLYAGTGDGGAAGDPENRAQDTESLLGKLLRLDVSGPAGYAIPADNPFVGVPGADEIWALGLRNPWVFSFDTETGDLYVADVGQNELEEVDALPFAAVRGANFGWRLMEGTACYEPGTDCDPGGLVLPVHEYGHGGAPFRCSISGGHVARGDAAPALRGRYLFADYCSRQIWALRWSADGGLQELTDLTPQLTPGPGYADISGLGRDAGGDLYVLDRTGGRVWRIVGADTGGGGVPTPPALEQNAPNPFNPGTEIGFLVPDGGARVALRVFDLLGSEIRTLLDAPLGEGRQTVAWDGTDRRGRDAPGGTYLYRLDLDGAPVATRRMVLLR